MGENIKRLGAGRQIGLWILVILLFFSPMQRFVQAQSTGLSVQPPASNLYLNGTNTVSVSLYVTNAVELQAFDLSVSYDPTLVHFVSWAHGGFLGYSLFPLVQDIRDGYIHLAFTKMGPPGASGNGNLLIFTFSGVEYGISPVTIETAVFSSSSGGLSYPVLTDGTINCTYASSPIIFTSLSGEVSLQGRATRGGIPVGLQRGLYVHQGPYFATSLEQPGSNLFFNSVAMDAYPITTAFPYYLNLDLSANKVKGLVGISNTLSPLRLLAGNVSDLDNEIDTEDLDLIKMWFGMTSADLKPGDELLGDANGDGVVDVRDLALAGGNFGLNGGTAYQGWLP